MLKRIWICCVGLFLWSFGANAYTFPELTGQVVDNANILSDIQEQQLTQTLQKANPHQVVAVSLSSLEGKEIEEYGVALGRHWGIGRKDINDGVLVLIAPNQRQMRIEVGYGLEGKLTDAKCSQIINRIMLPLAKQGKYGESLIKGSEVVVQVLEGKDIGLTSAQQKTYAEALFRRRSIPIPQGDSNLFSSIIFCFILVWVIRFTLPNYIYTLCKAKSRQKENMEFSEKELNEIHRNKIKYILSIIPLILFYSVFFLVGISFIFTTDFLFGIIWLLFSFFHSFAFIPINFFSQLKQKELFTNKEYKKLKGRFHGGHSSSGHWSSHSGGGSSFSGGGGSFGGGGSSGRW